MDPAIEVSALPQHRLYTPVQVMVASLLAGPLAACWLLAENYRALNNARSRWGSLLWGIGGTAALCVLAYFLPENFPRIAIPLGYTVGLYETARVLHGVVVAEHLQAGGRAGSWRVVVGFSLAVLVVIVGALLAASMVFGLPEPE